MRRAIHRGKKTGVGIFVFVALVSAAGSAEDYTLRTFQKITLTKAFHAEASGIGDFNKDGTPDVTVGPYWYAGPDFKEAFEIYPVKAFHPEKYSNNFITHVYDVNGDGFDDVIVNEWPGKGMHWFANPKGKRGHWAKHLIHPKVDNESIHFQDLTGDSKPELIFHTQHRLGYARPGEDVTQPWTFFPVSEPNKAWKQYTHGLGVGDVNGDGKDDFLMAGGWWEQPKGDAPATSADVTTWKKHPVNFGKGGAQMFAYDVDGDGDQDVITSIEAHGYGLAWFDNTGSGKFQKRLIMGAKPEDNPYGARFSQIHALCLVDMDGDGLKDIVTGKRWWAHGPKGDVDPGAPAVLYWFQLTRSPEGVVYIPHKIDDDSGVGTQFAVGDINGDAHPDIVIGNKKGGYVFLQEVKTVDQATWEAARPKRR